MPTATCTATPVDQAQIGAEQSCQINEQGFCNLTICGRVNDRFAITGCGTTDPTRETAPVLVGGGHNFYFDCTQPPNPRPCELKAVCAGGDEWSTTPTYDSEFSCYEAAENFFEHFYCGKIVNGECIVVHQEVAYDGVPLSGYGACPEP